MVRQQTLIHEEVGGQRAASALHNLLLVANTQELNSESTASVLCLSEYSWLDFKVVGIIQLLFALF